METYRGRALQASPAVKELVRLKIVWVLDDRLPSIRASMRIIRHQ
jgi:hypothetical protein